MNTQLCRASDPITSFESADRVKEFKVAHHDTILLAMLSEGRKLGAEQIEDITGLVAYQIRKRLPELEKLGRVRVYPETRLTATGRRERLWGAI